MNNRKNKKGFTLIELMVTIAIIGILAGAVMVSMQGAVDKSKMASAISTASSALPELVTCADDNGYAKPTPVENEVICWKSAALAGTTAADGHVAKWGAILSKTGWAYAGVSGTVVAGNYIFKLTKSGQTDVVCDMAANGCQ